MLREHSAISFRLSIEAHEPSAYSGPQLAISEGAYTQSRRCQPNAGTKTNEEKKAQYGTETGLANVSRTHQRDELVDKGPRVAARAQGSASIQSPKIESTTVDGRHARRDTRRHGYPSRPQETRGQSRSVRSIRKAEFASTARESEEKAYMCARPAIRRTETGRPDVYVTAGSILSHALRTIPTSPGFRSNPALL